MNFEEAMKELETVVSQIESGTKGLDESVQLFEKGIELSKKCQKMLDSAEKKVRVLMADGSEEDFAEADND